MSNLPASPVPFPTAIPAITNGQPLNSSVLEAPLAVLAQQIASLQQQVANTLAGSSIAVNNVPVVSGTQVGMAVYLTSSGVYAPALATAESNQEGFVLGAANNAMVQGIVYNLASPTVGSIASFGTITLTSSQLASVMVEQVVTPGQLFLGGTLNLQGYLTANQPALGVPVAVCTGPDANDNFTLFVNPAPVNGLDRHIHYKVDLLAQPAGEIACTTSGEVQSITLADDSIEGWLPASDPSFNGLAPANAYFGYNIKKNSQLNMLWPPNPVAGVALSRNGVGVRTDGEFPMCIMDDNGIWWMSDCWDSSPWSSLYPCGANTSSGITYSSGCPFPEVDSFSLWFVKLTTQTAQSVVTNLQAMDDSITILGPGNAPATAGPLTIRSNLSVSVSSSSNTPGSYVVKDFLGQVGQAGLVVEGITSDSLYITVSGTPIPDDPAYLAGRITLQFNDPNASRSGPMDEVQIDGATLQTYDGVLFYELPASIPSTIRGKWRVPPAGISPNSQLQLRCMFLVEGVAGTLPTLDVSYRQLPAASSSCIPTALPLADTADGVMDLAVCGAMPAAYNYLEAYSDPITVNPGDLLYFSLSRNAPDGYSGNLGVMNILWQIS